MNFSWVSSLSTTTLVFGGVSIVLWVTFNFLAWLARAAEKRRREPYVYYNTLPNADRDTSYVHAISLRGDLVRGMANASRTGRHEETFNGKLALLNLAVVRSDATAQNILAKLETKLGRHAYKRDEIFIPTKRTYLGVERDAMARCGCTFTQMPEVELEVWILSHLEWLDRVTHYYHDHPNIVGQWKWVAFGLAFVATFVTAFLVGRDATVLGWWR